MATKTITVYNFSLFDDELNLVMSTQVDELDPRADIEFWQEFITSGFNMVYEGHEFEEIDVDDAPAYESRPPAFTYTASGAPVLLGDVVHIKNRAYYVDRFIGDHIMLISMDESRLFTPVHPQTIGARVNDSILERA